MTHLRFDFQHLNNTTDIKRGFIGSIIGEFWGQKSVRGKLSETRAGERLCCIIHLQLVTVSCPYPLLRLLLSLKTSTKVPSGSKM